MFAFKTLSVVLTLAAGAFAAPILDVGVSLRQTDALSIPDILNNVTAQLTPLTVSLNAVTAANATADAIQPVIESIEGVLNVAIAQINGLASSPLDAVLNLAGSVLSIGDLANTVGSLLNLVFTALGAVLAVVKDVNVEQVTPLLAGVAKLVGDLLSTVVGIPVVGPLAGTLLQTVLGLVGGVLPVIQQLGVTNLLGLLGL